MYRSYIYFTLMALINPVIKSTSSFHESESVYILVLSAEAFSIIDNVIQSCFEMKTIVVVRAASPETKIPLRQNDFQNINRSSLLSRGRV